jgi:hypothetical protein
VEARHNRSKTRLWACNSSEIVLLENRYNSSSRKIGFCQNDALFLRITSCPYALSVSPKQK